MPKLSRVVAPDGRLIYCTHHEEVRGVAGQIELYLRHGITIESGDCVVDVGANIGLFSLEAARRGAKVQAFEPMPATFAALQANARALGEENIRAHNLALGAELGVAQFAYFRWMSALSTRFPALIGKNAASGAMAVLDDAQLAPRFGWFRRAPSWLRNALVAGVVRVFMQPRPVSCRVETLSRAIHTLGIGKIDLLKIDVEGAEWDVLRGISAHDWPRISQVVAEVHDEDGRVHQVENLLRAQGFTVVSEPEPQSAAWGIWLVWAVRIQPEPGAEATRLDFYTAC